MAVSAGEQPVMTRAYRPDWLEKPTADDMAWAYPAHAERRSIEGAAVMACAVRADGGLAECRVISEVPQGEDFGLAAVALSQKFRMLPPPEGYARPVTVTIPVAFRMPEPAWRWERKVTAAETPLTPSPVRPLDGGDLLLIGGVIAITVALLAALFWVAGKPGRRRREL